MATAPLARHCRLQTSATTSARPVVPHVTWPGCSAALVGSLNEFGAELGTNDRHEAYPTLRAFPHTLHDRLTVHETAQPTAQLPELIRGITTSHGIRAAPASYHSADEFLRRAAHELRAAGETETSYAVAAAATVLRRHVSPGEIEDVLGVLHAPIRPLVAVAGD